VFQCAFRVAAAVGFDSTSHEQVIARVCWLMHKRSGQVAASLARPIAAKINFSEASLSFFRDFGGKRGKLGQPAQGVDCVVIAAQLLEMPATGEETIHQVERHAHGTASVQFMGSSMLRSCTS
jgi:hypothetical protein